MTVKRGWYRGIMGAVLLLLVAGYFLLTIVTIRNHSTVALTDMTCAIDGRAICPTSVAAGATRRAYAILWSEDALVFSFRMNGNQDQAIIGYPIPVPARSYGIAIAPDMSISQETYFRW